MLAVRYVPVGDGVNDILSPAFLDGTSPKRFAIARHARRCMAPSVGVEIELTKFLTSGGVPHLYSSSQAARCRRTAVGSKGESCKVTGVCFQLAQIPAVGHVAEN